MKNIGKLLILLITPLLLACMEDDIEAPNAELGIFTLDANGDEVPVTTAKVGETVIFKSQSFTDYAVVWPGDRGAVVKTTSGADSTDIFGNPLYVFSHNYEDYGLDVGGKERKAKGFNMTEDEKNPGTKSTTYSYKAPGTYIVTLVVGNYGRYEVGVDYTEETSEITIVE